ncbi:IQ domain-containing protein C isoform X1 [Arapaima gigas]
MDRQELERRVTLLQARLRGFLVRQELSSVRQQYEDIVREIEGDVSALVWKGTVMPTPHFMGLLPAWPVGGTRVAGGDRDGAMEGGRDLDGQISMLVPERDCVQGRMSPQSAAVGDRMSSPPRGESEPRLSSDDEAVASGTWKSETETTSIWDSTVRDTSCSLLQQKGLQCRTRVQDLPRTCEDLRLHRNSLAMELLWIQQAIASRKKYLVLKQRLGTPGR